MNGAENALFAPVGEPILGENRPGFVTFLQVFLALGRGFRLWGRQNGPETPSGDLFGDSVKRFRNNLKGADPGAAEGL